MTPATVTWKVCSSTRMVFLSCLAFRHKPSQSGHRLSLLILDLLCGLRCSQPWFPSDALEERLPKGWLAVRRMKDSAEVRPGGNDGRALGRLGQVIQSARALCSLHHFFSFLIVTPLPSGHIVKLRIPSPYNQITKHSTPNRPLQYPLLTQPSTWVQSSPA
jgi:hypothetical protein